MHLNLLTLVERKDNNLKERCKNKKLGIAFKIVPFRFSRTNVFVNMKLGAKVSNFLYFRGIYEKNIRFDKFRNFFYDRY